jgi:2,3-dihydroxybenzoate decarboxylase
VPIYIHPALPHPAAIEAYYKDYAQSHPGILRAAWGVTVETATQPWTARDDEREDFP